MKIIYNKISKSTDEYDLPTAVLQSLYCTMVHPYYEYFYVIFANVKSRYADKSSPSQRKRLSLVFKLKWRDRVDDIYLTCNLLNVTGIDICQTDCFIIKAVNDCLPLRLSNFLLLIVIFITITRDSILIYMS